MRCPDSDRARIEALRTCRHRAHPLQLQAVKIFVVLVLKLPPLTGTSVSDCLLAVAETTNGRQEGCTSARKNTALCSQTPDTEETRKER
jgi:hypothetical protein